MTIVAVTRDDDKFRALDFVLEKSGFDQVIQKSFAQSGKRTKEAFTIAIKPNMMVLTNLREHLTVTTDPELVEHLIRWIRNLEFTTIQLLEAQNSAGVHLKGHKVKRVAKLNGYSGEGYTIVDLTEESIRCNYRWRHKNGTEVVWKHWVGKSWRDADFRISFAKCKSHESDYFTLTVKNVFGCFPLRNKLKHYHGYREVPDVTASSVWTFPIHFAVIDAFTASDGYQGYKTQKNPKPLHMMFAGSDAVSVDMECAKRGGIDPKKMHILRRLVEWAYDGRYPGYEVVGDLKTRFTDIVPQWENITDVEVGREDWSEEILPIAGLLNLSAADYVDFHLFPPRHKVLFYFFRILYKLHLHWVVHRTTLFFTWIWMRIRKWLNRWLLRLIFRRQVW